MQPDYPDLGGAIDHITTLDNISTIWSTQTKDNLNASDSESDSDKNHALEDQDDQIEFQNDNTTIDGVGGGPVLSYDQNISSYNVIASDSDTDSDDDSVNETNINRGFGKTLTSSILYQLPSFRNLMWLPKFQFTKLPSPSRLRFKKQTRRCCWQTLINCEACCAECCKCSCIQRCCSYCFQHRQQSNSNYCNTNTAVTVQQQANSTESQSDPSMPVLTSNTNVTNLNSSNINISYTNTEDTSLSTPVKDRYFFFSGLLDPNRQWSYGTSNTSNQQNSNLSQRNSDLVIAHLSTAENMNSSRTITSGNSGEIGNSGVTSNLNSNLSSNTTNINSGTTTTSSTSDPRSMCSGFTNSFNKYQQGKATKKNFKLEQESDQAESAMLRGQDQIYENEKCQVRISMLKKNSEMQTPEPKQQSNINSNSPDTQVSKSRKKKKSNQNQNQQYEQPSSSSQSNSQAISTLKQHHQQDRNTRTLDNPLFPARFLLSEGIQKEILNLDQRQSLKDGHIVNQDLVRDLTNPNRISKIEKSQRGTVVEFYSAKKSSILTQGSIGSATQYNNSNSGGSGTYDTSEDNEDGTKNDTANITGNDNQNQILNQNQVNSAIPSTINTGVVSSDQNVFINDQTNADSNTSQPVLNYEVQIASPNETESQSNNHIVINSSDNDLLIQTKSEIESDNHTVTTLNTDISITENQQTQQNVQIQSQISQQWDQNDGHTSTLSLSDETKNTISAGGSMHLYYQQTEIETENQQNLNNSETEYYRINTKSETPRGERGLNHDDDTSSSDSDLEGDDQLNLQYNMDDIDINNEDGSDAEISQLDLSESEKLGQKDSVHLSTVTKTQQIPIIPILTLGHFNTSLLPLYIKHLHARTRTVYGRFHTQKNKEHPLNEVFRTIFNLSGNRDVVFNSSVACIEWNGPCDTEAGQPILYDNNECTVTSTSLRSKPTQTQTVTEPFRKWLSWIEKPSIPSVRAFLLFCFSPRYEEIMRSKKTFDIVSNNANPKCINLMNIIVEDV